MGKRYSLQETKRILERIEVQRARGATLRECLDSLPICAGTYYHWRSVHGNLVAPLRETLAKNQLLRKQRDEARAECKALKSQLREQRRENRRLQRQVEESQSRRDRLASDLSRWYAVLQENQELHAKLDRIAILASRVLSGRFSLKVMQRHLSGRASAEEVAALHKSAFGNHRRSRVRAQAILLNLYGVPTALSAEILPYSFRVIKRYIRTFRRTDAQELLSSRRKKPKKYEDDDYKKAVFAILHSPPSSHGYNRTTWRRKDLHEVMKRRGMLIGHNYIDKIINNAGYRFLKAREVLTSNDPAYREKLDRIQAILGKLTKNQRFFSIDEFGPVSIKQRGGRRLVGPGEYPTVPQYQHSKGWLIVTAALELSTNQVTHFYSRDKNTDEMIKLLDVLLKKYKSCSKLFLSWDAAGWHASKRFMKRLAEVNSRPFRKTNKTPAVDVAPLPARAQFLNVIESVFSGLAVSVIHNSDYGSVDEAKAAIDRYFRDRNRHFRRHPRRAGQKIWGQERVPSSFAEHHNCKNSRFR